MINKYLFKFCVGVSSFEDYYFRELKLKVIIYFFYF